MTEKNNSDYEDRPALGRTAHRPIWGLWASIVIRAIHQVGAALVLAAVFMQEGAQIPSLSLYLAGGSGLLLCVAEGVRHRQMHRELSGMVTLLKCVILGLGLHHFVEPRLAVTAAFLIASIGAHSPRNVRHRLLL